jgi:hypothetical protein
MLLRLRRTHRKARMFCALVATKENKSNLLYQKQLTIQHHTYYFCAVTLQLQQSHTVLSPYN